MLSPVPSLLLNSGQTEKFTQQGCVLCLKIRGRKVFFQFFNFFCSLCSFHLRSGACGICVCSSFLLNEFFIFIFIYVLMLFNFFCFRENYDCILTINLIIKWFSGKCSTSSSNNSQSVENLVCKPFFIPITHTYYFDPDLFIINYPLWPVVTGSSMYSSLHT